MLPDGAIIYSVFVCQIWGIIIAKLERVLYNWRIRRSDVRPSDVRRALLKVRLIWELKIRMTAKAILMLSIVFYQVIGDFDGKQLQHDVKLDSAHTGRCNSGRKTTVLSYSRWDCVNVQMNLFIYVFYTQFISDYKGPFIIYLKGGPVQIKIAQ